MHVASQARLPSSSCDHDPASGASFRILVADDEAPVRRVLDHYLARAGHCVTTAADGLEAWERFQESPFPVVLSDIKMPRMDGIELLERVRAVRPSTEVVLITGFGETGVVIEALRRGASNFIEKPFSGEELLRQMEPAFHRCALALETARLEREVADLREREERDRRMLALGRLVSGISHEIHNPLMFAKGNAEILEDFCRRACAAAREGRPPDPRATEEMRTVLHDLRCGLDRIESMVRTLQTFGGRPASPRALVRLSDLMAAALRAALPDKPPGVELRVEAPPEAVVVEVNEAEMEICFASLLTNAFETSRFGGTLVRFTTRELPYPTRDFSGFVEVVVQDDGPGIPRGILDEVFTPFFTTKEGGTGLGLSIAYEAAKRNGAQVEIESDEGRGATVTVRLPFHRREQPPADSGARPEA